jgi:hypothetical protein
VEAATRIPDDKKKTAKNFAFNSTMGLFEWMASPGNEWRGKRAGKAMVQLHGMANGGIGEGKSHSLTSVVLFLMI